jgi:hypothetical protein
MIFANVTFNVDFLDFQLIVLWDFMITLHNYSWSHRSQKTKFRNLIELFEENSQD